VGATIRSSAIPIASALEPLAKRLDLDALELALSGGEDYELLAIIPEDALEESRARLRDRFAVALTEIGETTENGILREDADGTARPLEPDGWDHFTRG
jgi:thiamine-monophosphate kinase